MSATTARRTRPWPVVLVLAFLALTGGGFAMERAVGVGAVAAYGVAGAVLLGWLESFRRAQHDLTYALIKLRGEVKERDAELARRDAQWHGYVNTQAERIREEAQFTLERRLPAALARTAVPPALHADGADGAAETARPPGPGGDGGEGISVWFDRMLAEVSRSIDEREESQRLSLVELANRIQTSAHRIQAKATGIADRYPGDTDLLETTMQVDHAATQQARHAQSLKVLCDEWPGQQWQEPLALVDVVRAASGRIMSYRRVEVTGDPDVGIAAIVVEPLIHLIAELLANATEYSPPRTAVPVAVRPVQRGAVIEVDDGGLGLDDYRLAEAREIVSGRRLLGVGDVGEIPQTGFAVIGRFARRHGFGVDLGPSPYGGIRAVVLVPLEMLEKLDPPGTAKRRPAADEERPAQRAPGRERSDGLTDADVSPADPRFVHNPLVPQPPRKPRRPELPAQEPTLPRREAPGTAGQGRQHAGREPGPAAQDTAAPAREQGPGPQDRAGTGRTAGGRDPYDRSAQERTLDDISAQDPITHDRTARDRDDAPGRPPAHGRPAAQHPAAPEPLVPEPRQRAGSGAHDSAPEGPRRLPRRRSARGESRPMPNGPSSTTPPGTPEEAGEWMSAFFEGCTAQEPPHPRPAGDDGTPPHAS
ncbi:sensor histidine kinase [Streptomyces tremellae]|uniref:sensor histidine kinase n=1 Tax=Streptomyces tremellae TaxID=1124239 RepID=UPI0031EE33C7